MNAAGSAPLEDVVKLDAGNWANCALTKKRKVWCWGQDWWGQIGDGSRGAAEPLPKQPIIE